MQKGDSIEVHRYDYIFQDFDISDLTTPFILTHSSEQAKTDQRGFFDIHPKSIEIKTANFIHLADAILSSEVKVLLQDKTLTLSCGCNIPKRKLCEHQVQVLFNMMHRPEIRAFFDDKLRQSKLREEAVEYGIENEENLDDYFQLQYVNKSLEIKPKLKELFPISKLTSSFLEANLAPQPNIITPGITTQKESTKMILVIGQHRYYKQLSVELFDAHTTKGGNIKNPLNPLSPLDFIWKTDDKDIVKFFTAISGFKNNYDIEISNSDIQALKALVKNPLQLEVFYHKKEISDVIKATSVVPVKLGTLPIDLRLSVDQRGKFYEVNGHVIIDDTSYPLDKLNLQHQYFLLLGNYLHLIDNFDFLRIIDFFKKYSNKILLHESKFEEFRQNLLSKLESRVHINYSYLKPATAEQLQEIGLDKKNEKLIYLSDSDDFVLITPVMKYGTMEIPVLSRKQLYGIDLKGEPFSLPRNEESELRFTNVLINQHPDFKEQMVGNPNKDCFYLHKSTFLKDDWFLEAFEAWQKSGISVLGFKELGNLNFNPNKAKISVSVNSGINWFDTAIAVDFGSQKVALKHLQKAAKNKTRFIILGDGTTGILPEHWIEKFSKYFQAGEIEEEILRIPKVNFTDISILFEEEVLSKEVKRELAIYKSKLAAFEVISHVEIPVGLKASLRDYQKQGLNWLNFLDEFNFGGCLADDMGLGKTIQIIAFILSQRKKRNQNTNLVVVPTSLIFNWQAEVKKYAPSIKILTIHGTNRKTEIEKFNQHEIVLTTYGTLLADINFLRKFVFNYIILDESQAIKNPESQRYKAARLLQSRNKLLLTGTPIENNTFDLYGQLSFACQGLLGSKQYFKRHYSTPIDRFSDNKRAKELQQKINPFLLRRTKEQVAKELPEKTEMVIYCEMGAEQRKVYDAYAKQFREFLEKKKDADIPKHTMHVLQGLTKLRQICNSAALLADEQYYGDTSAKIEVLIEQIESKSPQHKILVFSQFVRMLELIKKELDDRNIGYQYLTGQTKERSAEVEKFQNNSEVRIFLISLKAGGTGLNLTEADYVYIVDPWWNPAVENQAIDRSHRIGQHKNVVAVRLICPDTIEEKMMVLQDSKKSLAKDLIKTDTAILKSLSKKELVGLFS